jgi:hypothetical protein
MADIPYAYASSGERAQAETRKILRRLGCEKIGLMTDDANHEVVLYFEHRGRAVQLRASAKGWAAAWLKKNPLSYRSRKTEHEHKQQALNQGRIAVSSMLRDWVKGQVTAIETGMLTFEQAFMPHMLTSDGRPLIERMKDMLPAPEEAKIVALPARSGE